MSFLWECDNCNNQIIVPYESPRQMSPYAQPYCSECYKTNRLKLLEDECSEEYKQDNGNPIIHSQDGMVFYCELAANEELYDYLGKELSETYKIYTDFQKIANEIYYNKDITRKEILNLIAELL